jgi:hypothetical protein
VPQTLAFEAVPPDRVPPFPEPPASGAELPDTFLEALHEASLTTAKASARFAVTRLQLRGRRGEVVGTDGRQLLVWGGFPLPWEDDVLVPRLPLFGHRDTPLTGPVAVGRTEKDVSLRVGPWSFALEIDTVSRYPQVDRVIPAAAGATTRLLLDPADAALLIQNLPKLPGRDDAHAPVTLDLGRAPAVRARAAGGPAAELPLARSAASGRPVRVCMNRDYLRRALQLGFAELQVSGPTQPVCCRDGDRLYLWVPLATEAAVPPDTDAVRVTLSAPAATEPPPIQEQPPDPPTLTERRRPMPAPTPHGDSRPGDDRPEGQPPGGFADLFSEAEALRALLHDALGRAGRLLAALKQPRRQARAVETAMTTLRQLRLGR